MEFANAALRGSDIELELTRQEEVCDGLEAAIMDEKEQEAELIRTLQTLEQNLVNTETDKEKDTIDPAIQRVLRGHVQKDSENLQETLGAIMSKLCDREVPESGPGL